MAYGLTPEGFREKPVEVIDAEIAAAQRASPALGTDWDTSAESPSGQLNAAIAAQLAELWEVAGFVYRSRDPRQAIFAGLDGVCAITGVERLRPTKGTVTLALRVGPNATIPAGAVAHVDGQPSNRWVTKVPAVNATGAIATVNTASEAEAAGRIVALANTITRIATPMTGWLGVNNPLDAEAGTDAERDPVLRARRGRVIRAGGSSPLDAIRAALLPPNGPPGVQRVSVFENPTDFTSGGLPPHSVLAIVTGGSDDDVATAIYRAKGAGIETTGNVAVPVVDTQGTTHLIRFRRPTDVNVFVRVTVERDAARYAGDAAVKAAVVALGDELLAGDNVRLAIISRAVLAVAGIVDVPEVLLGRAGGAARIPANLPIGLSEIARIDTSRIEIVQRGVTS